MFPSNDNSVNFALEEMPIEGMDDSNEQREGLADDIIGSSQSLQVSNTNAASGFPAPRYSPGNAGLHPRLVHRELPDSPGYVNRPTGTIVPEFRMMDLPGSGEPGRTTPTAFGSDSTLKALDSIDLPEIDNFRIGPSGRTEYLPVFPAQTNQHPHSSYHIPDIPDHGPDGCHDRDQVRAEFKEYLISLYEPGAIKLLDQKDILKFDPEMAAELERFYQRLTIEVPPKIPQFSFDLQIFLPTPPDRSGEFLALGADPELVKVWKSDFVTDVEDARKDYEMRFASGGRDLELNRERYGDELTDFAQDTLRHVIEVCYSLLLDEWVDSDLEKYRRGEWFLNRDAPDGPSNANH